MSRTLGIQALLLFNEKAERLLHSNFVKNLQGSGFTIKADKGKPVQITRRGPSQDNIDAFVLTIRFFIQDNENSSFRRLFALYPSLPIPDNLKQNFQENRNSLNSFLNAYPKMNIQFNGKKFTNREILEVFIYGNLAHRNVAKTTIFKQWASDLTLLTILQNEFVIILSTLLNAINATKNLNLKTLAALK